MPRCGERARPPQRRLGVLRILGCQSLRSLKTSKWVRASKKSSSSTTSRGSRFKRFLNSPPEASTRRRFLPVQPVGLMRILFDQGVPRGITASLGGHEVTEARKFRWERISNGELLNLAEGAGFDLLLTTDKNVRYQQNLAGRKICIVVLGNSPWWLVRQHLDEIVAAVNAATPGS
jgi:hypothetical protein